MEMKRYGYTLEGLVNFRNKYEYDFCNYRYDVDKVINEYFVKINIETHKIDMNITYDKIVIVDNCNTIELYFNLKHYNNCFYTRIECCIDKETYVKVKGKIENEIIDLAWADYCILLQENNIIKEYEYYSRQKFNEIIQDWKNNNNFELWNKHGCFIQELEIYEPELKYLQEEYNKFFEDEKIKNYEDVIITIEFNNEVSKMEVQRINSAKIINQIVEDNNNNKMVYFNGRYWGKKIEKIVVRDKNNKYINIHEL